MFPNKVKLSGSQCRKRRKKQEQEDILQGEQLGKYLKPNTDFEMGISNQVSGHKEITPVVLAPTNTSPGKDLQISSSNSVCNNLAFNVDSFELPYNSVYIPSVCSSHYESQLQNNTVEINDSLDKDSTLYHHNDQIFNAGISSNIENVSTSDMNDPALWPLLTDNFRQMIIRKGPYQLLNFDFPTTNKRKFNPKHYYRNMSNGGKILRNWLIYSVSKNSVFCFCCKLFGKTSNHSLCNFGFSDWNHIVRLLKEHETSAMHNKSFTDWKLLEIGLRQNNTIDSHMQKQLNQEINHWKEVLKRLFIFVQFLGCQSLAFRGSSDVLFTENNGNFLQLVEAISKIDPVLAEHIRRIQNKETRYHYLSKNIQNEIIQIISTAVQNKLIAMIKKATYYSIIVDSTPDAGRTEQISLIIRFVHHNEDSNEFVIKEHFLGFIEGKEKTGEGFSETILNILKKLDLSIKNCRGQGYDNAANMKGKHSGMQSRIKNIEPRAFFVPCSAHSLNLVVNDSADAKCSLEASKFFDDVQSLYVFFCKSTKRWDILKANITYLTLKPLSDTRWSSRIDALRPLKDNLGDIYEALIQASEEGDSNTKVMATALENIYIASKTLQSIDINISIAVKVIKTTLESLKSMRNDEKFEHYIDRAEKMASNLEISTDFCNETALRSRRKKSQFDYEASDTILSPKEQLKIKFYYTVLDQAISSITERFHQLENHSNLFSFLYDISELWKLQPNELNTNCMNLAKALTNDDECDLNGNEMVIEMGMLSKLVKPKMSPKQVLDFLTQQNLNTLYPNTVVALQILLTLPVTVASGERSFSKLKIIKNYLRTSMTQERLVGLATISIEKEIVNELNFDDLIDQFANIKSRKIEF